MDSVESVYRDSIFVTLGGGGGASVLVIESHKNLQRDIVLVLRSLNKENAILLYIAEETNIMEIV